MIISSEAQLELKFEVFIDTATIEYTSIKRVNIELSENMHDLAVLDIAGLPAEYLTEYIDLPIAIRVVVGRSRSLLFNGYISYLEPESVNKDGLINKSPFQLTRMYCFGASYTMRSRKNAAWNNVTLTDIVSTFSDRYDFSASVPQNTYVFPRLIQSGESDWSLLKKACNYLGYRVSMRTTHIDIWDPYTTLSRYSTIPIYAMYGNSGGLNAQPGQVLKFNATVGVVTPESAKIPDKIHALVDDQIVTLERNTSTGYGTPVESFFADEVAQNASSVSMAQAVLQGRSREKFPYTAHVEVVGDPAIQPGMVVQLLRYNSNLDGLWIVKSARHEFLRGSAISYLTIEKDSEFSSTIEPLEKVPTAKQIPDSELRNSRWITTREYVDVY